LAAGPPAAAPAAGEADEEAEMGRRLQEALRAQRGEVHKCYAASLEKDAKAQGELLVQVEIGERDRVRKVQILKDQTDAPGLAACLTERIAAWTMKELKASPGTQVVFPLIFRPDQVSGAAETPPPSTTTKRGQQGRGKGPGQGKKQR
jgi:hypothetical protein